MFIFNKNHLQTMEKIDLLAGFRKINGNMQAGVVVI